MEKLIDDLYPFIFNNLDIKDLPKCRLVSKKWRFFIDKIKPTELIVNKHMIKYWNFTCDKINSRNLIKIKNLSELELFPYNLTNLKRLSCDLYLVNFNKFIDLLNSYCNLKQLEIRRLNVDNIKNDPNIEKQLDLIKLKYLVIDFIEEFDDDLFIDNTNSKEDLKLLKINSPNLKYLAGTNLNFINFQDLLSLTQLEPDDYDFNDVRFNLVQFKNIKYLVINNSQNISRFNDNKILSILPNLEEIRCYTFGVTMDRDYYNVNYFMDNLIEERLILKRSNLKIYYLDVELAFDKSFLEYKFYKHFGLTKTKVYWYLGLLDSDDEELSESTEDEAEGEDDTEIEMETDEDEDEDDDIQNLQ